MCICLGITGNDVDEFLDTDEMNRKVMPSLEQFVNSGAQLVRYKSATQVAIGGASGWYVYWLGDVLMSFSEKTNHTCMFMFGNVGVL